MDIDEIIKEAKDYNEIKELLIKFYEKYKSNKITLKIENQNNTSITYIISNKL